MTILDMKRVLLKIKYKIKTFQLVFKMYVFSLLCIEFVFILGKFEFEIQIE
jgi:hypothetical protein